MAGLTPVELVTLAALSEGALHGYGLVVRIEALTEGRLRPRPGNLYRVLHRLEVAALVKETATPGGSDVDERRRYFRATAKGRRMVAAELGMYADVLARTPALRELRGDA